MTIYSEKFPRGNRRITRLDENNRTRARVGVWPPGPHETKWEVYHGEFEGSTCVMWESLYFDSEEEVKVWLREKGLEG
jgi:hypothetical protein